MPEDKPHLPQPGIYTDAKTDFERVDNRWDPQNRSRDWVVVAALVIIYLIWTGTVFFFEPGIR